MATFDPDTLTPAQRAAAIQTGKNFGSDRVVAQSNETLKHGAERASTLRRFGFPDTKRERLQSVVDAIVERGADRNEARVSSAVATKERHEAERAGKLARNNAIVVLESAIGDLQPEAEETKRVEVIVSRNRSSGSNLIVLDAQLAQLESALQLPTVAEATNDSGGPESVEEIGAARAKLGPVIARGRTNAQHTPAETEELDLLDGVAIDLCRQARKAARAASKALGMPALEKLFELDLLYGRRTSKPAPASQDVA